ncbi:MAG: HIRAN domain-containing protein [Lysobacterales bacterium]
MTQSLFVTWRSGDDGRGHWGPVGRLDRDEFGYRFVYLRGARTLPGFVPFAGMPDLEQVYQSDELFPLFANRLLARSRPEYQAYLSWMGFEHGQVPDPIAILSVTAGRRATDQVEVFPCPAKGKDGRYQCDFFVHGVRWSAQAALELIAALKPGDLLALQHEPDNSNDPNAVAVLAAATVNGLRIGYVPRYLCADVLALQSLLGTERVSVRVRRVNSDAPLQQRLLCRLSSPWPDSFEPCSGEEYTPIVDEYALC